jgi:D-amino-acid oxidase
MPIPDASILPTPDFNWDPVARPPVAGLRPYRDETFRLEPEIVSTKFIVHNYGHGGAGITLSWGCAQEVVDFVIAHGFAIDDAVAVLGSGVIGMTTAILLSGLKLKVTIYTKDIPPHTTSNIAGGQWAPSLVNHNDQQKFDRILRRAFSLHAAKGAAYGVSPRLNYTLTHAGNFESCPKDVIAAPKQFNHLPFEHLKVPGYDYSTLLVEPPILLPKLRADLVAANVEIKILTVNDLSEVTKFSEKIIVNCTGLGSRKLCHDQKVRSYRGQLVLLPTQPKLQYLFSGHGGYLFPRQDCVIVGGSEEPDVYDPTPDMQMCNAILENMRNLFTGGSAEIIASAALPPWAIRSK